MATGGKRLYGSVVFVPYARKSITGPEPNVFHGTPPPPFYFFLGLLVAAGPNNLYTAALYTHAHARARLWVMC